MLVCVWLMFHFTLFVGDAETRYELATNYLGFIAFNVGINILLFLFFIVKKIYSACSSMFAKRRAKRQAKNKVAEKLKKLANGEDDSSLADESSKNDDVRVRRRKPFPLTR